MDAVLLKYLYAFAVLLCLPEVMPSKLQAQSFARQPNHHGPKEASLGSYWALVRRVSFCTASNSGNLKALSAQAVQA